MINTGYIFLLKLINFNNEICIRIGSKKDIDKKFFSEFKNNNGYYCDKKNKNKWKHIDILKLTYINNYEFIEQNIINKLKNICKLYLINYNKTFLLANITTDKIINIYNSELNDEHINMEKQF